VAGFLLAASFPKFGLPGFAWPALAPLIVAVALRVKAPRYTAWAAFRLGLATGLVFFSGALYWTVAVMTTYGGLPTAVAVGASGLLALYLSLYVGIVAALIGSAVRRFGVGGIWWTPVFWVAAEWTRGALFGGFPWTPLGSSQSTVLPVAQLAAVTGVHGISFLVALVGTAAAAVALTRRRVHLAAAAGVIVLLIAVTLAGSARISAHALTAVGTPMRIGLVQGNIPQDQKWDDRYRDAIISRYVNLSRNAIAAGAQVVVWPEASTPFFLNRESALSAPMRQLAAETRTPFVIGTDEADGSSIYNSAGVIRADGGPGPSYRKIHLVPFGEFVPLKKILFFIGPLVEAVSDFSPGTEATVLDLGNGVRAGVSICYESIYPDLSRAFVGRGANLLMVITNDAWFGTSSAAFQHYEMGVMRAIENGRYLVRAANTGITAAVDPYGRVLVRAEMFDALSVTADVRLINSTDARTIYSRTGDLIAWISTAITLVMALAARRRRIESTPS
jgi:apolipoprotein N-acyltransferase